MLLQEFNDTLNRTLPKLLDEDTFIKILNLNNNLYRFDIINRIALNTISDEELLDVKTEEEWFEHGRRVIDKHKKYYIISPKYGTCYVDSETSEKINILEFTFDELTKALELGVIIKTSDIDDIVINEVYDIRNTSNIDKNKKYEVVKTATNLNILVDLAKNITGLTIEPSEDITFYSEYDNNLFLAKEDYNTMADKIINIIVNSLYDKCKSDIGIDNMYEKLIKSGAEYSIKTLFGTHNKKDILGKLKSYMITDYNILLDILVIIDIITFKVLEQLEQINGIDNCKSFFKIERNNKINTLLNIMQANSVQIKMKGIQS